MAAFRRFACAALCAGLVTSSGCGADNSTGQINQSPEAINADEVGRKAMEEMIKSQGKSKNSARGGSRVAPGPSAPGPGSP